MPGLLAPIRQRIRLVLVIAIILIALVLVVPSFLGCETGLGQGLSTICLPGIGTDTYDITGKNFAIGRFATWRQPLFVRPNNVVTMQIEGTLDLVDATKPRTFQINDLTLIRGGGVIRAGGNYTIAYRLIDGPIFGSGTLVLDDHLRLEASDLNGSLISLNFLGSRLMISDQVTLYATGSDVIGIDVYGDVNVSHSGEIGGETPTLYVQGSETAVGVKILDGRLTLTNGYLRVEGADSVGVTGGSAFQIETSQVDVPDGVAVQMVGDGRLTLSGFSRLAGGLAAVQGDDGVQFVDLTGAVGGNVDLGDGADHLRLIQDRYLQLKDGSITLGAGDDELTLDYSEGVIDTPLDGGDGTDTLAITLHLTPDDNTPTEADIAAAVDALELPGFHPTLEKFRERADRLRGRQFQLVDDQSVTTTLVEGRVERHS